MKKATGTAVPSFAEKKLAHLVIDSGAIIKGAGMTLASAAEVWRRMLCFETTSNSIVVRPVSSGGGQALGIVEAREDRVAKGKGVRVHEAHFWSDPSYSTLHDTYGMPGVAAASTGKYLRELSR